MALARGALLSCACNLCLQEELGVADPIVSSLAPLRACSTMEAKACTAAECVAGAWSRTLTQEHCTQEL